MAAVEQELAHCVMRVALASIRYRAAEIAMDSAGARQVVKPARCHELMDAREELDRAIVNLGNRNLPYCADTAQSIIDNLNDR